MEDKKFKTAQGMLDYGLGVPNPDDPGMTPKEHQDWQLGFLEDCLGITPDPEEIEPTFFATRDAVTVENTEGRILGRWGLTDFYDAIPQSPDRGPCRLEYGGRTISVECALREWEQWNGVRDELVQCREFIPLEDWINQYCEHEDLIRTFNLLKSLS